jgi:hypothetical protein
LLNELACQTEMTPDALRQVRAIQVLEQIGSPQTLARKTYRLLKEEPPVVSKWQLNPHLSQQGGSRSWLQTVLNNLPSGN